MEDYVSRYYTQQPQTKEAILEKSDQDIELDQTFALLDYTSSVIGQQYLYFRLKRPLNDYNALIALENQIQQVTRDEPFRLLFEKEAKVLAHQDSSDLPYLIFSGDLKALWYYKWIPYIQGVLIAGIILSLFFHWGFLVLIALFGFNLYLHFHNKMVFDTYRKSLNSVITLHDFCGALKKKAKDGFIYNEAIQEGFMSLKALRKKLTMNQSLQLFTSSELYMVPWLFYELVKAFTLLEVRASVFIVKEVNLKKDMIHQLYKAVGRTDFLLSIVKLRLTGGCCVPQLVDRLDKVDIKGLYHPIIENCVRNDFKPGGGAVLITGSNAAGKSTFLRSMALNNLLAGSIHTCFAASFSCPLLTTMAAMHHNDALTEGLSHYQNEVKGMAEIFKFSARQPCLLLFDEPFNGTNSRERIAIAAAVLEYFADQSKRSFAAGPMILVASHDFALLELLQSCYKMFYFNEQVHSDGKISFDYRLKEGRKVTRNALELIKIEGFPMTVVEKANQIYRQMDDEKVGE